MKPFEGEVCKMIKTKFVQHVLSDLSLLVFPDGGESTTIYCANYCRPETIHTTLKKFFIVLLQSYNLLTFKARYL